MQSLYPRHPAQLVTYLTEFPRLDVLFPTKRVEYVFKSYDGIRLNFDTPSGQPASFPLNSVIAGSIQYNEDGFTRTVGKSIAYFNYTGEKPWKDPNPPWQQSQKDWDVILRTFESMEDLSNVER